MSRRRKVGARLAGALILGSLLMASFSGSIDGASRSRLAGTKPSWATSKALVGHARSTQTVGFRLYLGWRDAGTAAALAQAVSNPKSSSYGHFLTPAQFRSRFAPTAGAVAAVQKWLKANGLKVTHTPANRHFVAAQGTVKQIQNAFATTLNVYKVSGIKVRAPSTNLSVPTTIAKYVSGVIGIDESYEFIHSNTVIDKHAPPSAGFRNAPPLSDYWAQFVSPYAYPAGFTDVHNPPTAPWAIRGHTPAQVKGAYGISGFNGAGQTVAVIDAYASPTILQDVNQWSINRGLPTMTSGQFRQIVPPGVFRRPQNPRQDPQGWYGEETLDIEAVHGMAPAANIVYVGAPNNYQDLDAAMNHVVDRHLAQIVTNSYGWHGELLPPGFIKPFEQTLMQGAIEGIGIYFSSGDSGDETSVLGIADADFPASSPWVTAVGGTSLGVSANNTRAIETGWGTSNYACDSTTLVCTRTGWLYGAGGGDSRVFAEPSYQASLPGTMRHVPDVAALGDPQTGYLVGQTQSFPDGNHYDEYRIGGTSLSSPIFAGLMALADQAAGSPHGFANPLFYAHPEAFYDVTSVKTAVARRNFANGVDASDGTSDFLRTFDDYSGSPTQSTHAGWDNVTGLGTPGASFLATFGQ
ncbi:MAG: protease pro-enzyme activation domain-containing protein [Chloroflexota bacterium]